MAECYDVEEENFLRERIAKLEEAILKVEEAVILIAGGATSYSLNSGQTTQSVTKTSSSELKNTLNELLSMRAGLKAQLDGASVNLRPGW
jgi:hypothetical protein